VTDYDKMRQGVGALLAELMRIKAEGDYDSIKALVDQYGVHFGCCRARRDCGAFRQPGYPELLGRDQLEVDRTLR